MPKIQIDVDRNIYPSEDSEFEYQANCKTGSVYFNRTSGDLGFFFCPNSNVNDWQSVKRTEGTWHSILPYNTALPTPPSYEISGNKITYGYPGGKIQIQLIVQLDGVRRLIIINDSLAIQALDPQFFYEKPVGGSSEKKTKKIEIKDSQGKINTIVKTVGAWDSSTVLPCCNSGTLCGKANDVNCKQVCPAHCKRDDIVLAPAEYPNEDVELHSDSVKLVINSAWLDNPDRVFPIYINDDITPAAGSLTGNGGWAVNTGNLVDDDTSTAAGNKCFSPVDNAYANNYVTIDLGASYTIEGFKIQVDMWSGQLCSTNLDANDWFKFKLQYKNNGGYSDFAPSCEVAVPDGAGQNPRGYLDTQRTSNDVSGQSVSVRYVRLLVGGEGNGANRYGQNNLTGEIEIHGTAGGTAHALKGSLTGAGGAAAVLIAQRALSGDVAGISASSGGLRALRSLIGSLAATSGLTAGLKALRYLRSTEEDIKIQVYSFVSGILSIGGQIALKGSLATASAVSGAMRAARLLSGSTVGTSSATGSLIRHLVLSGSSAAASAISGGLRAARKLIGSIGTTSAVSGVLSVLGALALRGAIAAASAISGGMHIVRQLRGSTAGTSSATGSLIRHLLLSGSSAAASTVSGVISLAGELILRGSIAASSAVSGSLVLARTLAGSIAASSTSAGSLILKRALSGAVAASSAVSGALSLGAEVVLKGVIAAASAITGAIRLTRSLAGSAAANSAISGALRAARSLTATITASSAVSGGLRAARSLLGAISAISSVAGRLAGLAVAAYRHLFTKDIERRELTLDTARRSFIEDTERREFTV